MEKNILGDSLVFSSLTEWILKNIKPYVEASFGYMVFYGEQQIHTVRHEEVGTEEEEVEMYVGRDKHHARNWLCFPKSEIDTLEKVREIKRQFKVWKQVMLPE